MKMAKPTVALLFLLTLAACGGSSSGSFDAGREARLSISPESNSLEANPGSFAPDPDAPFTIQVNVNLRLADGSAAPDGSEISLSSSSTVRAVVSSQATPSETAGEAAATTSGGVARFWLTGGSQTGSVTLTAATDNPSGVGTVSASTMVEVVPASVETGRLIIQGDASMPTNRSGVPIFLGSPYINELTVRYQGPDGNAGEVEGGQISVAVSPVTRGAFSTLDDPATDENEFEALLGSGPVNMTAGVSTIFIHSFDRPGALTVSVTAQDAESGERFSEDFLIEVEDGGADFLPADLSFGVGPDPVYVQGAGGPTTKSLTVTVTDSGGNPVPNPEADGVAFNNVVLELDAPAGSGARLTGTSASGSVSGTDINVRTVNGVANFTLNAGTETGTHRITATVDRADNNVDNDFQDGLSAQTSVSVGDGRLFSLRLVSPVEEGLVVNPAIGGFQGDIDQQLDPETGEPLPPGPDGTYSYLVTVIATDRQGNPPLPNQPISFGKIDSPTMGGAPGMFVFSGPDGDPEEGGVLFTAADPADGFLNDLTGPSEAVEAGDTLVLFGKSVQGNREHEAVRTVASVIDDNTLTVAEPFNLNDQSGEIVDDGAVIPWVIGRSEIGFVDGNLTLDERGRGSVRLTYPANAIGRPMVLWAQGEAARSGGGSRTIADAQPVTFPGLAPLVLTASPASVFGNTTADIRLCLRDGLSSPVDGAFIRATADLSGELDGRGLPTETGNPTGSAAPGCVDTRLTSTGLVPGGEAGTVVFAVGEATAEVEVVPPGTGRLVVSPSTVTDTTPGSITRQLTLQLLNGENEPISGVSLVGSCDGGDGTLELTQAPGTTDSSGRTTAGVLIAMAGCGDSLFDESFPRIGQCEFTTSSGTPVGLFTAEGVDLRGFSGVSPAPPGGVCEPLEQDEPEVGETLLAVDIVGTGSVTSEPGGIDCGGGNGSCSATFSVGTVLLEAPSGTEPLWSGDCSQSSESPRFATVDLVAAGTVAFCSVDFEGN